MLSKYLYLTFIQIQIVSLTFQEPPDLFNEFEGIETLHQVMVDTGSLASSCEQDVKQLQVDINLLIPAEHAVPVEFLARPGKS